MAVQAWTNVSLLEGAKEVGGHVKNFEAMAECGVLDTTAVSSTGWTALIAGNKTGTTSFEFMQDFDSTDGVDLTFWNNFGTSGVVRSICTNAADGSAAYLMRGVQLQYTPLTGATGELAMGNISTTVSDGPMVRGLVLHPKAAARTSSGTGTGRQLGAVASGQTLYAALHVLAVSGTSPTLDVIVQSDNASNFPSPTSRITFSQATTTTSAWGSAAGAITDDWFRVSYTIGGTNPSFTFVVTCGYL